MKPWEKDNLLGDLILPVKVNPDLPIKWLFGRSGDLKGEELPDQAKKKTDEALGKS